MTIRPVAAPDWQRVGELAELLVRAHHAFNALRFIPPEMLPASAYVSRVQAEIERGSSIVFVAERDGRILGFVFAGIEPESWKELRGDAGYIHDLVVDEEQRHSGIGRALLGRAIEWLETRGAARIMLWTAPQNAYGRRLFESSGFTATMIEMTRQR